MSPLKPEQLLEGLLKKVHTAALERLGPLNSDNKRNFVGEYNLSSTIVLYRWMVSGLRFPLIVHRRPSQQTQQPVIDPEWGCKALPLESSGDSPGKDQAAPVHHGAVLAVEPGVARHAPRRASGHRCPPGSAAHDLWNIRNPRSPPAASHSRQHRIRW